MRVQLENVGVIEKCDVEFIPGINLIVGSSGSGKSTLMRCIYNVATNEFSDSDISFGKNTMNVRVIDDGNVIEYSRSIKAKGERCFYKVNNETYVKLGRQALPAVSNALKIGDIDINGDSINFNFNLQFSSPFLILGNQSTLYNVLTYRSTYDISSINDYYAVDVKSNASETVSNIKLKERLEASLESLEADAEKLSPIEQLYSDYTLYKHKLEIVNDLKQFLNKLGQITNITNELISIDSVIKQIGYAETLINKLDAISTYKEVKHSHNIVADKVTQYLQLLYSYENALEHIQKVSQLKNLLSSMIAMKAMHDNVEVISNCINGCVNMLQYEQLANDAIKQKSIASNLCKCTSIVNVLSKCDDSVITKIDDLMYADKLHSAIHKVNDTVKEIEYKSESISAELSKFEVCPLCGVSLYDHKH